MFNKPLETHLGRDIDDVRCILFSINGTRKVAEASGTQPESHDLFETARVTFCFQFGAPAVHVYEYKGILLNTTTAFAWSVSDRLLKNLPWALLCYLDRALMPFVRI